MPHGKMFIMWLICSNDYAGKTCIEILCKKTCCIAPDIFVLSLIYSEFLEVKNLGQNATLVCVALGGAGGAAPQHARADSGLTQLPPRQVLLPCVCVGGVLTA